ncbi:hypothetical protein OPQ81_009064 [Rhizoctonia solani]|nr:hypothetical protein OPQ81_009064 [Rhizoctonia solani]
MAQAITTTINHVPTHSPRAPKIQPIASEEIPLESTPQQDALRWQECKDYIKKAQLAHAKNKKWGQRVERKALIVAPQYKDYEQGMHMSATAFDIKLVHEMLVNFGYEPGNIRILCDVCPGSGSSYPTKMNILDGLEWLTDNSEMTPGCHRFFHFSGHGTHIPSDKLTAPIQGKLIRDSDWKPEMTPVTRDTERSSSQLHAERIMRQEKPPENVMKYYNEAILTRKDVSDEEEPFNQILDSKLNEYMSKLPEDCTITCTLDCCASGRMLNLDEKVAGSGWRAGWRGKVSAPTAAGGKTTVNQSSIHQSVDQTLSKEVSGLTMNIRPTIQIDTTYELEDIPPEERAMNHVVAKIFSWSASHQRQEAWNDSENQRGLFTRVFTKKCLELKDSQDFTYGNLYKAVSGEVTKQRGENKNLPSRPQFVQVRSGNDYREYQ